MSKYTSHLKSSIPTVLYFAWSKQYLNVFTFSEPKNRNYKNEKNPPQNYKNESNIFISEAKDMLIVSIEINFMGFFNAVIFRDPTSYFSLVLLAKHVTDYIVFVNEKQREWLTITDWGNTCSNSIVSKLKQHPWMFGVLSDLFCCWHE